MHMHPHGRRHEGAGRGCCSMSPLEAAAVFMLGAMAGCMAVKRAEMMCGGQPWMKHHGMGTGMGMGMRHHHHGFGQPPCKCGDWPQTHPAEPGAPEEKA